MEKLTKTRINCGLTREQANSAPLSRRAEELCSLNKDFIQAHKDEITPIFGIVDIAAEDDSYNPSEALQEIQKNEETCKNCPSLGKFVGFGNADKCLMDSQFRIRHGKQTQPETIKI